MLRSWRSGVGGGLVALTAALGACGGGNRAGVPVPPGLVYTIPALNPVAYTFADTAAFTIETGGTGAMRVNVAQAGRAELAFRYSDTTGLSVTIRFPEFRGSFANASQGASRVDESAIGGPFVVRLDPRGHVTVVDTPSLTPAMRDVAGPESLVRPFFVHLAGREVTAGASWEDTVRTSETSGGTTSRATSVIRTTVVGDTVIDGRRLLLLRTRAQNEIEVTGVSGGVDIDQRVAGVTDGTVVWDERGDLLVERRERGRLSGSLSLPSVQTGTLPVRATVHRIVRLATPLD